MKKVITAAFLLFAIAIVGQNVQKNRITLEVKQRNETQRKMNEFGNKYTKSDTLYVNKKGVVWMFIKTNFRLTSGIAGNGITKNHLIVLLLMKNFLMN